MPKSRQRKEKKKNLRNLKQKAPIFMIRETEFGPVREWIGEKTITHLPKG